MIIHEYELADDLPVGQAIDIVEDRGRIVYKIASHLAPEQIISALNEGAAAVLAGGHWFQEWKGDIVAADPHSASRSRAACLPLGLATATKPP